MITILIRTSGRPRYFDYLINNLRNQMYRDFKVIIGYDSDDSQYVFNYKDNFIEKVISLQREPSVKGSFPWNLYENILLKKVSYPSWIMYLDDDDQFVDENSLATLVNELAKTNEDTLLIWKVRIHNRVVPEPNNWGTIQRTHISGIGFSFHTKYKAACVWDANKGSDYRVILNLSKAIPKILWVNKTLTKIQQNEGFGKRRDRK